MLALGLLVSAVGSGCAIEQRAAEKMIDPGLRTPGAGLQLERERARVRGGMKLGPYEVRGVSVRERAFAVDGSMFSSQVPGRPIREYQLALEFAAPEQSRTWTTTCTGQRRQSQDADFAATAGEARDDVAIRCQLAGAGGRWEFTAEGNLGQNFEGTFSRAQSSAAPGQEAAERVEILLWFTMWKFMRRSLPTAAVQIRRGERAVAAMILARPERAWVDEGLEHEERELSLALLVALRYLPIGFDEG